MMTSRTCVSFVPLIDPSQLYRFTGGPRAAGASPYPRSTGSRGLLFRRGPFLVVGVGRCSAEQTADPQLLQSAGRTPVQLGLGGVRQDPAEQRRVARAEQRDRGDDPP